ncbi:hypothetical protein AB0362_19825 [Rhodococcus sp. NPDC079359]|uniref:hypothetical protein n=1 Tax=Rhodococcus sp. NPDC079359 TaxID=3154961 RepID=UPI00344C010D
MRHPASHRTHLVSLSPWRNALDVYVADDEAAEEANNDLVWESPDTWDIGDVMIIVVPGRQRAILNVEVFSSNSEQGTFEHKTALIPTLAAYPWPHSKPAYIGLSLPHRPLSTQSSHSSSWKRSMKKLNTPRRGTSRTPQDAPTDR